jgi:hypothetical protein
MQRDLPELWAARLLSQVFSKSFEADVLGSDVCSGKQE